MGRRLFGTDGVRGVANQELSPLLAFRLARAAGALVAGRREGGRERPFVLVASDTRVSSGMLDAAVTAGLTSVGVDAVRLGILPTPGLSWLTHHTGAAAGVMISASHNPVEDNGIKIFGPDGYKLSDDLERHLEDVVERMEQGEDPLPRPTGRDVGRVRTEAGWADRYLEYLAERVPVDLSGMRLVLDCANGAAHRLAPRLFAALGAEVRAIHTGDSGEDINVSCGSTHPEVVAEEVRRFGADAGLSFDGDADRCIAADERGNVVDGDQLLTICALDRIRRGKLPGGAVACTVYSNGGLREALRAAGGDVIVTPPGDRHVLEAMRTHGLVLGGEQSGHLIFLEHSRTGDGMLTGLMLLDVMRRQEEPLSHLAAQMRRLPQALVNVRVARKEGVLDRAEVQEVIARAREALGDAGRVYVRPSGTEPLIRVMVEASDPALVDEWARRVVAALEHAGSEGVVAQSVSGS
ncbi:phosphoglucosamine mutase [Carboxydochorda subterranea]|uniref:Phosphoglucosamine mutase n=1 Tax=Carboxydichorda subterranea TaxID=3109565 RepID=A0ABZ1BV66_9FIRM|nr:phosphoglucosamine mutase [Limnochorda sp. L945t]WRP16385.1 phosphoglucosamine mutase [Limnochorda sp. L945t]